MLSLSKRMHIVIFIPNRKGMILLFVSKEKENLKQTVLTTPAPVEKNDSGPIGPSKPIFAVGSNLYQKREFSNIHGLSYKIQTVDSPNVLTEAADRFRMSYIKKTQNITAHPVISLSSPRDQNESSAEQISQPYFCPYPILLSIATLRKESCALCSLELRDSK